MAATRIKWLAEGDPPEAFPALSRACIEPDGLLAAGGDLTPDRLLYAYRSAIFPWYESGQPILWWSPDPRCIILPKEFHVSRSLRRRLPASRFEVSFNRAFHEVIVACTGARRGQSGTWITPEMLRAYRKLHRLGWAHSVDIWRDGELVGGLYGIAIGRAFFGESMFSRAADASKTAMLALCQLLQTHNFAVLDCQVESPHLLTLGAKRLPRREFATLLEVACDPPDRAEFWPKSRVCATEFLGSGT